eukprot:2082402-Pyramimonas_sp.AAC.1
MHAGISVLASAQDSFSALEIAKVKAHQDLSNLEAGSRDWFVAKGNEWADRVAKLAAAQIPSPSQMAI